MSDLFSFAKLGKAVEELNIPSPPAPKPSDSFELPPFPNCEHLLGSNVDPGWISIQSICYQVGVKYNIDKHAKLGSLMNVVSEWSGDKWTATKHGKLETCVAIDKIQSALDTILKRKRKNRMEKADLYAKFNIVLTSDEVEALPAPVENQLLFMLQQAMPYKMEYQYRVGKYRLDAFIPRLRIAIQIDEDGHASYPVEEEQEYNEVMRDSNIVCIRFSVPRAALNGPDGADAHLRLIKAVWERAISPDFIAFRHVNSLA